MESPHIQKTTVWSVLSRAKKCGLVLQASLMLISVMFLLRKASPKQILSTLKNASPPWVLAGFVFFALADVLRTLRFTYFLHPPPSFKRLFPTVIMQGILNTLLPARLGEVAYLYLLKQTNGIVITSGLSSLLLARIGDTLAIALLFFVSALFLKENDSLVMQFVARPLGGLAILCALAIYSLIVYRERALDFLHRILSRVGLLKFTRCQEILAQVETVLSGLQILKSGQTILLTFLISLGTWSCIYLAFYCLSVRAVNLPLNPWQSFRVASILQIIALLPIHLFGGLGTMDIPVVFLFKQYGIAQAVAISAGLASRAIFYGYTFLWTACGLFATWTAGIKRDNEANSGERPQ